MKSWLTVFSAMLVAGALLLAYHRHTEAKAAREAEAARQAAAAEAARRLEDAHASMARMAHQRAMAEAVAAWRRNVVAATEAVDSMLGNTEPPTLFTEFIPTARNLLRLIDEVLADPVANDDALVRDLRHARSRLYAALDGRSAK